MSLVRCPRTPRIEDIVRERLFHVLGFLAVASCGSNNPARIISSSTDQPSGQAGAPGVPVGGGAGGSSGADTFTPLCSNVPLTAAGAAPTKGGVCTAADPQLCYKTCGPFNIGFKSETCSGTSYSEMMGCSFPAADYSCYKIPAAID